MPVHVVFAKGYEDEHDVVNPKGLVSASLNEGVESVATPNTARTLIVHAVGTAAVVIDYGLTPNPVTATAIYIPVGGKAVLRAVPGFKVESALA